MEPCFRATSRLLLVGKIKLLYPGRYSRTCSVMGGVRTCPGTRSDRERFKSPALRGNGKEGAAGLCLVLSLAAAEPGYLLGREKNQKSRQWCPGLCVSYLQLPPLCVAVSAYTHSHRVMCTARYCWLCPAQSITKQTGSRDGYFNPMLLCLGFLCTYLLKVEGLYREFALPLHI